jgi:hypothetical protein
LRGDLASLAEAIGQQVASKGSLISEVNWPLVFEDSSFRGVLKYRVLHDAVS